IHRNNDIGRIKEGKLADFVVLSENPYEKDPSRMDEINIIETYVDGCGNNLSGLHKISPFDNMFMFVTHEKTPY
ncbi:amidohydrolase family protein, partial [Salmonella sp. s55004]|uniref:amidohydrolase family protein n=1 Tax=Salmonella sp. s55004 TaxID=3159675 RepID=UPI0039800146